MTALKGADIDRFLERPDRRYAAILVYGPDTGQVSERARQIARKLTEDPDDPFQLVRIDGDQIAADPGRLVDEVNTIGLFGGRRTIWAQVGGKSIHSALETILTQPPADASVVIEAGDLNNRAPLRVLCERSPNAACIPCYLDDERALTRLIDDMLRQRDKRIDPEARTVLLEHLGGDRLATRGEIEKLFLYVGDDPVITPDHVTDSIGDTSTTALDTVIDGAFGADPQPSLKAIKKLTAEGLNENAVLAAAMNHALLIARGLEAIRGGRSPAEVAEKSIRYFKRRGVFERQLRLWSPNRIESALRLIGDTVRNVRQQSRLADTILERMLLSLALLARRRDS